MNLRDGTDQVCVTLPPACHFLQMRARKLKFGLAVGGLVAVGGAVPWIACQWQFKKAQG